LGEHFLPHPTLPVLPLPFNAFLSLPRFPLSLPLPRKWGSFTRKILKFRIAVGAHSGIVKMVWKYVF